MKKSLNKFALFVLAACLFAALLLSGCSQSRESSGNPTDRPGNNPDQTGSPAGISQKDATLKSTGTKAAKSTDAKFASSFKTVKNNPIYEDIQFELWLTASLAIEDEASGKTSTTIEATSTSTSPLKQLSDKRTELVNKEGVHYTEAASFMGFDTITEYWIKEDMFKKVEDGKITIFDGKAFVEYDPSVKSGTRYTKELKSAEITLQINSMLPSLSAAPYEQKEDQKINGFDCGVFYLDMEMMGMKGNTLFVDKETGMLIKYLVGDDKEGLSNTITKFESGNIDDKEFKVPKDIKVEDYKG